MQLKDVFRNINTDCRHGHFDFLGSLVKAFHNAPHAIYPRGPTVVSVLLREAGAFISSSVTQAADDIGAEVNALPYFQSS